MARDKQEKIFKPNKEQEKCIKNLKGRYLVLAGPGTGKTTTVVYRIKHMLEQGIDPEKILCLSFSDTAAAEMQKKLDKVLGETDTIMNIYTFHAFCNEIIGQNAEDFELPEGYRVITPPVTKQFIKECIDEYQPEAYRNEKNNPYGYVKSITDKIDEIKHRRVTKSEYFQAIKIHPNWEPARKQLLEDLAELKKQPNPDYKAIDKADCSIKDIEKKIKKANEIWEFYERYKAKMEQENYIDFNDMIEYVLDKFKKSPAFLDKIANKYEYIMVDEYQDTNEAQNELVFDLVKASKSQNIFVVGDDDQIIYSFQGANLETINGFLREFPETQVVVLKENMRSIQPILDVARVISKQDPGRLEVQPEFAKYNISKDLFAKNEDIINKYKDNKVRCIKYNNKEEEFTDIANEIGNLIESDNCPKDDEGNNKLSEIAILCGGHSDLAVFADLLKDRNIPFERKEGQSIFEIKSSLTLFYYMQMLVNPELYADKIFQVLMLKPYSIHPIDFSKIYLRISKDKTFIESMRQINEWEKPEKIKKFLDAYDYLTNYINNETVRNCVMEIGSRTGIFDTFLNEKVNQNENIAGLKKIINEAGDFSETRKGINFADFVDYLTMVLDDKDLDIKTDKPDVALNAVQLTTYYSAKGKEYDYVYMPTLQADLWNASTKSFKPTIPVLPNKDKTDEEWKDYKVADAVKTMYVGMTRARHTLRLSYVATKGKKATYPCPWIIEAKDLMEMQSKDKNDLASFYYQSKEALTKRDYDYKRDFMELIKGFCKNREHSHSSVDTYRGCPRKYFYKYILAFEGRGGISDGANYGSAVHDTCQYLVEQALLPPKKYPSKEDFMAKFDECMDFYPFSSKENEKMYRDRGHNELNEYYKVLIKTKPEDLIGAEVKVEGKIDGINITGRIDKVVKNPDGTVDIYDYKTTNALTLKEVCKGGKYEGYYNQVCLYKYFAQKLNGLNVNEVKLSFPIDSSELSVPVDDDDCKEVFEKFKEYIRQIEGANFEPSYNPDACKYCPYTSFCGMNII